MALLVAIASAMAMAGSSSLPIDVAGGKGIAFDGLGGLSGGGSTTRLLIDYPE
jgi:hypothetical protein